MNFRTAFAHDLVIDGLTRRSPCRKWHTNNIYIITANTCTIPLTPILWLWTRSKESWYLIACCLGALLYQSQLFGLFGLQPHCCFRLALQVTFPGSSLVEMSQKLGNHRDIGHVLKKYCKKMMKILTLSLWINNLPKPLEDLKGIRCSFHFSGSDQIPTSQSSNVSTPQSPRWGKFRVAGGIVSCSRWCTPAMRAALMEAGSVEWDSLSVIAKTMMYFDVIFKL